MVFDAFFHKKLRYNRSHRESMVILGWHGPLLNTTATVSASTLRTISAELRRMDCVITTHKCTWDELAGKYDDRDIQQKSLSAATIEFLSSYNSFVKLDVQYWRSSLQKGNQLIDWLESRICSLLVGELGLLDCPGRF